MKSYIISIILFIVSSLSIVNAQTAENKTPPPITDKVSNEGWINDAHKASELMEKNNAPLIINFTGSDWCGWCKKIKAEIFDTDEFKAWVKENKVVLLELDFPRTIQQSDLLKAQNQSLAQQFQVKGYPTIFVIKGKEVIQTGYVKGGPENWIKSVEENIEI
ncbi:thioredoxin family protein [Flammeovirga kamogawensis]|uniref:Thioredoxin family protein n=1 Tax=Flammeovirga kamogawensis TaxID=373891 RepID=A0ABX8H460_9BACT|nr:thioredoxin family protein [Flammeovirga kamogawensis]MBB6460416.1 protein disulfide-isomerase [Flammeovirga kamogawensis]QWG10221.1 thioredoxin family protein [Flammeovirga kamogawensis]TRX64674.1 thioredoxin family protein [Flammeovirga kamogawensis]